jgi:O-antigen/teichoic acid export membrane protein
MMAAVALAVAVVIAHHFLEAVFAGLRLFRVVSAMNFCQSMAFALVGLTLISTWRADAVSVIVAYAAGCLISASLVLSWTVLRAGRAEASSPDVPHNEFWPPLMRFAVWVWVTNLLCNLFAVVDRYMIVHCGGFSADDALAQVGNYHASAIVPLLLVSVANLLVGAMTPHLSHDWEAGRRREVSSQINLTLVVASLGSLAMGVGVLLISPTLFSVVFEGRYAVGAAVAPWTLASCVWFSLLLIAQTYAWCAEKSRRAAAPLALGLALNVALNLLLLPWLGLLGALVATGVSTLAALLAQLESNRRIGMRVSKGAVLLTLAPFALAGGLPTALAALGIGLVGAFGTEVLITCEERRRLGGAIGDCLAKTPFGRRAGFDASSPAT